MNTIYKNIILIMLVQLLIVQAVNAQFTHRFELNDINGQNGLRINNIDAMQFMGTSVSHAGDYNADGISDIVFGAPGLVGKTYVLFGNNTLYNSPLTVTAINGGNGFIATGIGMSGFNVSDAGDFNGDGIDDVIITQKETPIVNDPRIAYIVYGSDQPLLSSINLLQLDGSDGLIINKPAANFTPGYNVSKAGDVNNDGFDDIMFSSYFSDHTLSNDGIIYIIYGSNTHITSPFEVDQIDGSNGIILYGEASGDNAGKSLSNAGDFNGDGIDDFIITAPNSGTNGSFSGTTYMIFGNNNLPNPLALSSLNGTNGFKIQGVSMNDFAGSAVDGNFDFNGDGVKDIIIGATGSFQQAGGAYVMFGRTGTYDTNVLLSGLNGANGFAIRETGSANVTGFSVSSAGDVNGDQMDDVIIGGDKSTESGFSYVIYGTNQPSNSIIDTFVLPIETGFTIVGFGSQGLSVGSAGDFNNDGVDDILIGAPDADNNLITDSGSVYIIYGKTQLIFTGGFE
jgi:hypothetical protein